MSTIERNNIKAGVHFYCRTLGQLIDDFEVKLKYFMNEKKRSIQLTEESVLFNQYDIVDYCENPLHLFIGKINNNITVEVILDIRHELIYFIKHDKSKITIEEYDFDADLINQFSLPESDISLEEIIIRYVKRDYLCYNVNDLLVSFNLDYQLSSELKEHIIIEKDGQNCEYCCGHKILFSDYEMIVINNRELYVFKSMFDKDTIIFDSEAPVYYIDFENQELFIETKGMVGICILQFNEKNEIIKDAHSWIVDIEMFLGLTDN